MINISVISHGDTIHRVDIKGHSGSADRGEDLICAGVSSIGIGTLNALDEIVTHTCTLTMKEACIHIDVICKENRDVQIILQTMMVQLATMQLRYPEFINIQKQEV